MSQTPEDAASDFADAIAVRELRSIRDTITSKLREAYLAGYAHASNVGPEPEREDWIDPSDVDALLTALDKHAQHNTQQGRAAPTVDLESRSDKYPGVRDAMRVGWINPEDRGAVLEALLELTGKGEITDADLADYIGDASCMHIPDDLHRVLSTGFDLHGIDTLADLATELEWQLAVPDRGAA